MRLSASGHVDAYGMSKVRQAERHGQCEGFSRKPPRFGGCSLAADDRPRDCRPRALDTVLLRCSRRPFPKADLGGLIASPDKGRNPGNMTGAEQAGGHRHKAEGRQKTSNWADV